MILLIGPYRDIAEISQSDIQATYMLYLLDRINRLAWFMCVIIQVWSAHHFSFLAILHVKGWVNIYVREPDGGISKKHRDKKK